MGELHKVYGLNLSIEQCKHCSDDGAILFYGSNIEGQAPSITPIACTGRCIIKGVAVLVEVDKEGKETEYCVTAPAHPLGLAPGRHFITEGELRQLMGNAYRQTGEIRLKTKI